MSEFEEVFKSSSTTKLLKIISAYEDYEAEAINAAKAELEKRDDISEASELLKEENAKLDSKKAKTAKFEKAVQSKIGSTLDLVNPLQRENPSSEKRLRLLVLVFAGLSVYSLIKELPLLRYMLSELGEWDPSIFLYFLPLIILPTGTYLLYRMNKTGWGLLYAWSIVNCYGSIQRAIHYWNYEPTGFPAFDLMVPETPPSQMLAGGLVVGLFIVALLNGKIRDTLQLDKRDVLIWTAIGITLPLISLVI